MTKFPLGQRLTPLMNLLTWLSNRQKSSHHIVLLLALSIIVLLLPAGAWDLRGPDEARYTQIARELLGSNNWFALTIYGRPYDQKPPLMFWLLTLALKANGGEISSWFLRMPSILAAIGTMLCTYFLGRRFAGPAAGLFSALFLLTSIVFLDDAPTVELNMLYTFFTTAALAVWLFHLDRPALSWPQATALWLLVAAAFLVKGPLAILVVLSAVGGAAIARRSWQPYKAIKTLWGVPLLLAVIAGWFWAQSSAFGNDFVEQQVQGETVGRFLKGDHAESFWYYFPRLITSYMGPWAFFLFASLLFFWKQRGENPTYVAPLIGWITIPFIVLLLANGKRVPYLLPLLPAACLLSGTGIARKIADRRMGTFSKRAVPVLLFLISALAVAASLAVLLFPHKLIDAAHAQNVVDMQRLHPELWLAAGIMIAMISITYLRSRRTWITGIWSLALAILIVQFMDFATIRPAFDVGKSTRPFSTVIDDLMKRHNETTLLVLPDMGIPKEHIYGHYKVDRRNRQVLDFADPTLPSLLALRKDEIDTSGPQAEAAGYRPLLNMKSAKNLVRVYLRDGSTTATQNL